MKYIVKDVTHKGVTVEGVAILMPERDESIRLMPGRDGNYSLTVKPCSTCFETIIEISQEVLEELVLWHRKRVT